MVDHVSVDNANTFKLSAVSRKAHNLTSAINVLGDVTLNSGHCLIDCRVSE